MIIAVALFTYNDLPLLRATLFHHFTWADQVCVLDMASTDGTYEFCQKFLRSGDVYLRRAENTVPQLGADEAINALLKMPTAPWIALDGANYMFNPAQGPALKAALQSAQCPCYKIKTKHFMPPADSASMPIERAFTTPPFADEYHVWAVRRDMNFESRGYVHSELYLNGQNCHMIAGTLPFERFHFQDWHNATLRRLRGAYMLWRGFNDRALQAHTNSWWYTTFVPNNLSQIERDAAAYEKYCQGALSG